MICNLTSLLSLSQSLSYLSLSSLSLYWLPSLAPSLLSHFALFPPAPLSAYPLSLSSFPRSTLSPSLSYLSPLSPLYSLISPLFLLSHPSLISSPPLCCFSSLSSLYLLFHPVLSLYPHSVSHLASHSTHSPPLSHTLCL